MSLRRLRRSSAPAGRHTRAVPGPLVPGAAATLVAAADHWDDPVARTPVPEVSALEATAPIPVAPVLLEVPAAPAYAVPAVPAAPAEAAVPVVPVEAATAPAHAPVSLVFSDGASVDLDPDDPRVRTFRAAAAALLEAPRP